MMCQSWGGPVNQPGIQLTVANVRAVTSDAHAPHAVIHQSCGSEESHWPMTPLASLIGGKNRQPAAAGIESHAPIPPCGPRIRGAAHVMTCHSSSVLADSSRVLERQDYESCTIFQQPKFTKPHKH